jgi:hypothetical protein
MSDSPHGLPRRRTLISLLAAAFVSIAAVGAQAQSSNPAATARAQGTAFLADSVVGLKVGGWLANTPNQGIIDRTSLTNGDRSAGGSNLLTDTASVVMLQEYRMTSATSGVRRFDPIVMPYTLTGTANRMLTMSSNSGSEGALRRSADGRFLTMAGYDQAQPANTLITSSRPLTGPLTTTPGTMMQVPLGLSVSPSNAQGAKFDPMVVNRTLGRVDALGNVNTTTALNNAYSGDNIRAAVSFDGSQFWTAGNRDGGSATQITGGVRHATLGSNTSTQVAGSPSGAAPNLATSNINKVDIYNGQLYASVRQAANNGIWQIGTGTPTSSAASTRLFNYTTLISGAITSGALPTGTNFQGPYDFFFASDSIVYVADALLGISKFVRNGNLLWEYGYTFTQTGGVRNDGTNGPVRTGGAMGLAGRLLGSGQVALYGTGGFNNTLVDGSFDTYGGNYLFALIDGGANSDVTILDIAAANEHFKGVALAPVDTAVIPLPPAMALMLGGLALLGAVGQRRRQRA